nr:putative NAD dependent epimerase/dehydratase family protein [uncultured bacterium]
MTRILITGAHGFIGKHLAKRLASHGHVVVGLGHGIWPASEAQRWGVSQWLNGDIQAGNLRMLQQDGTPDVVYHLAGGSTVGAAIASPREDFFRTVASTVELLEWLRLDAPATKLVAVSSAAVYGAGHQGLIAEEARLQPYSPYGHHKQMMESLCRSYGDSYGLQVAVARLFSVFGPELKKQLLWDMCTRLAAGESPLVLGGSGNELRDWVDVRELARALELLPSQATPQTQAINVGTGVATSVREIALGLMTAWHGQEAAAEMLGFSGSSRPGDPFSLVADPHRLNSLGFEWKLSLSQGLVDYVNWFRTQAVANT